jgi:hypothetical protein
VGKGNSQGRHRGTVGSIRLRSVTPVNHASVEYAVQQSTAMKCYGRPLIKCPDAASAAWSITAAGAKPSNRSNLFKVADRINALLSPDAKKTGPFWCASEGTACQYISQKRPPEPFQTALGYIVDSNVQNAAPYCLAEEGKAPLEQKNGTQR